MSSAVRVAWESRSTSGILFLNVGNSAADHKRVKGKWMINSSEYLEGYRDAQAYDVEEGDYDADYPLTLALARELGSPLLDLACGTGTMALRMAEQGFEVTGVDIIS